MGDHTVLEVDDGNEIGLTQEEVNHFIEYGYVMLKNAFKSETAAACREFLWNRIEKDGVKQQEYTTWPEKHWISESYNKDTGSPWDQVITPRLKRAMDQLCGEKRWKDDELTCGWWVITFPGHAMLPWGPAGHWHVDGARYVHHLESKESGLLPIFVFSDLNPSDGGTALAAGSHVHVAHLLHEAVPHGMKGGKVSASAKAWVYKHKKDWVEVQGKAGDVMLTHPFLMHARSKNCGSTVRFMCNPNVGLKEPMEFNRSDPNEYSAVELAIVHALDQPTSIEQKHRNKRKRQ